MSHASFSRPFAKMIFVMLALLLVLFSLVCVRSYQGNQLFAGFASLILGQGMFVGFEILIAQADGRSVRL